MSEAVAIQGELGSFSHQAAGQMLPRAAVVPCALSAQVFEALMKGRVQAAVIPIENSLAGPVTEHYDLLLRHSCYIESESRMRIVHNLIAAHGVRLSAVRRVLSHPVALAQCRRFFDRNPRLRPEPFYDTAGSVKHILEQGSADAAAIAGILAAREYSGRVLKAGIEDNNQNFTRFLLVRRLRKTTKKVPVLAGSSKTSIAFAVRNRAGTLFRALRAFADEGISMAKIESRPVPGKPWEYVFYADLHCGPGEEARRALAALRRQSDFVKILGIYPSARE